MMLKLLAESRKRGKKTVTNAQPELDPLEKKKQTRCGISRCSHFSEQQTTNTQQIILRNVTII